MARKVIGVTRLARAVRKDAARYRWLRSKAYKAAVLTANGPDNFWTTVMCLTCNAGETFDQSVDKAMSEPVPQTGSDQK